MSSFALFFLLLGIISIISQVVIVREFIASFFGNELFVGIILGIWLLGTGLGSLLSVKLFPKIKTKRVCFLIEILLCLLLPLLIILIRFFVGKTLLTGEVPSFYKSLFFTFLTLFPFCFLLGGLFSLGGKVWANLSGKKVAFLISRAYFLETIGFAIGGVLFNFFLISSTFPLPANLNIETLKFRYSNLVEVVNSRYGNILVTQVGNQYNFYESGTLLGTNEEKEASEYLIHIIFAFHQNPKSILLIGGGLNGPLFEVLKYRSVAKIDYVELDPKLVEIQSKYLPDYLAKLLRDPKIKIHFVDGRRFLKKASGKYDVVIFNLPNPSTALLNRFYTKECFEEAKRVLADNGILSFTLDVPVDYLSEEAKGLAGSLFWTVKSVLPHTLILPEETSILFISSPAPLPSEGKLTLKHVETNYFTPNYLSYLLSSRKINQIKNLLTKEKAEINTDFQPTAYFYQTAFWQTTQSFKLAKILQGTKKINWVLLAVLIPLLLLLLKRRLPSPILSMGIASFTLMTVEVLIIFLFQSKLGYIFSKIALIFTTILISMGGGNLIGTSIKDPKKGLVLIKVLIVLCLLAISPVIKNFSQEAIFYLLGGMIGLLVGTVFPLTNRLFFATAKERPQGVRLKRAEKVGILYSSDLFGAFFGAILPSVFFIPIFGVQKTIILLIVSSFFSLSLL